MKIFQDYRFRQWIYGIIAAALAIMVGYGFITSEQTELWMKLAEAVLELVPSAALTLAATKAEPANSDTTGVYKPRHAA